MKPEGYVYKELAASRLKNDETTVEKFKMFLIML